jgi:outer membrane usher protein
LAQQPEGDLQPALFDVVVNKQNGGQSVFVLRGGTGEIYVARDVLATWRLKLDPARTVEFEGKTYIDLSSVDGLTLSLVEETQSLEITATPELLEASALSIDPQAAGVMTKTSPGMFLNYELLGEHADGKTRLNGAFEFGAFSAFGFGTSTFTSGTDKTRFYLTRLDTSWTMDDPATMQSLRIGDSITRGGIGGAPVRFGGVQFGSNFAVQPGFLTIPLPTVSGTAALPSVIDIYVNDTLRGSRDVLPGPFSVIDVPVVTGSGDVQLIVRDVLGRESLISQSYYAAPQLLRRGLHDYSFEAGFLRRNYARKSNDYGAAVIAATHRYGFTEKLTGEAHVEATLDTQSAGVSGSFLVSGLGLVEALAAASKGPEGSGGLLGFTFERRTQGLSFGARSEFTTRHYANISSDRRREAAAMAMQVFAGMPIPHGSIGASYLFRDARGGPDAELFSANASLRLDNLGTLHLAGRKNLRGKKEAAVELFLTVPLGGRTSASAGVQQTLNGINATADLQRNLPVGEGSGYRVSASMGAVDRLNGRLSLQTTIGAYDSEVTWSDGKAGIRFVTGGAIASVGGDVFASRRLSQSFATVRVGKFKDVRVYSDNQLVGKTNGRGVAIVPRLRPFEKNIVRIDLADLPIDTSLAGGERVVRPHNRSGVAVDFEAKRSRAALLRVRLQDGEPLPTGAVVRLEGNAGEFLTASEGEVYLSDLKRDNLAFASWGDRTCRFTFSVPENGDPQPRLGPFECAIN